MTTRSKKVSLVLAIVATVLGLTIFGTYLANGYSWAAVIRLLTLPQCMIGYAVALAGLLCWIVHKVLAQGDDYHD